jgi:hypothetical protein
MGAGQLPRYALAVAACCLTAAHISIIALPRRVGAYVIRCGGDQFAGVARGDVQTRRATRPRHTASVAEVGARFVSDTGCGGRVGRRHHVTVGMIRTASKGRR